MPNQQFGDRLAVKENALRAISQIRGQVADPVIAIVDHPPGSCCHIGFHALSVSRAELPLAGFTKIGAIEDMDVAMETKLMPADQPSIVLGFDSQSGTLVAYVNE